MTTKEFLDYPLIMFLSSIVGGVGADEARWCGVPCKMSGEVEMERKG
jgi:hypothetical protein